MTDETPVVGTAIPTRGRMRSKCEIKHADPGPLDKFAPCPKCWPCVDREGRRRAAHSWDGDGVCVFCDSKKQVRKPIKRRVGHWRGSKALRRMEPL